MLICKQCDKTYEPGNKFCKDCGSALDLLPDAAGINENSEGRQITAENSLPNPDPKSKKGKKTGAAALIGMFIINLLPIIGFPFAFIWAWVRYNKNSKIKLVVFTVLFIIINITSTVFGYAAAISLMEKSLAKAADNYGAASGVLQDKEGPDTSQDGGIAPEENILEDIPGIDFGLYQDFLGIDPGMSGMFMPDYSSYTGGVDSFATDEYGNMQMDYDPDVSQTYSPDSSGNFYMDEEGNMYIDSDGDGEYDCYVDKQGNAFPLNANQKTDEHGNRYFDIDQDGKYDYYVDKEGNSFPVNVNQTDEHGNRYFDTDQDGKYNYFIDSEGNSHYDIDGDGIFETTFEAEYGEG